MNFRSLTFLAALVLLGLLTACNGASLDVGGHKVIGQDQNSGSFSYHFKIDNECMGSAATCGPESNQRCEVGKTFANHDDYCNGLRDGVLNESCARMERKSEYLQNCGATFEDTGIHSNAAGSFAGACTTDQTLGGGPFTRSQLCQGMLNDIALHPCIAQNGWYDSELKFYSCQ